jgi:hypothetical protein
MEYVPRAGLGTRAPALGKPRALGSLDCALLEAAMGTLCPRSHFAHAHTLPAPVCALGVFFPERALREAQGSSGQTVRSGKRREAAEARGIMTGSVGQRHVLQTRGDEGGAGAL